MSSWLRYLLIVMTIGGGFAGFTFLTIQLVSGQVKGLASIALSLLLIGFFVASVAVGLVFVSDERRTLPLYAILLPQVLWFSSPILAFDFYTGARVAVGMLDSKLNGGFQYGASASLFLFKADQPAGIGINLLAVGLLIALHRADRAEERRLRERLAFGPLPGESEDDGTGEGPPA